MLQIFMFKHHLDWAQFLPLVQLYYNAAKYSNIQKSPHIIVYGHDVQLPADLLAPTDLTM